MRRILAIVLMFVENELGSFVHRVRDISLTNHGLISTGVKA